MDSSYLVLDALLQESGLLIEEQKQLMLEDARILNEGISDFLNSIKDAADTRLKNLIERKYSKLEDIQKKNEMILTKNKINVPKIKSLIEGSVSSVKSQLMSAAKKGDKNLFQRALSTFIKKVKDFFEKNPNLFNWRTADPSEILVPLGITIVIITIKALILFYAIWILGPGLFSISSAASMNTVGQLLLLFLVMPFVEEAGQFISIKTNSGGKYFVMFNVADFALTMAALPGTLLSKLFIRITTPALRFISYKIQKQGIDTDQQEIAFRNSFLINSVRNFVEIIVNNLAKAVEVAEKSEALKKITADAAKAVAGGATAG